MVPGPSKTGRGVLNGVQNPFRRVLAEAWHGLFRVARALAATAVVWRAHLWGTDTRDEPLIMTGEQVADFVVALSTDRASAVHGRSIDLRDPRQVEDALAGRFTTRTDTNREDAR